MLKRQTIRLHDRIQNWYRGEREPPLANDPFSPLVFIQCSDRYKKSASAKAATMLVEFWRKHWQWTIGISVAGLGLLRLMK
jgi:hypothetical protein